MLVANDGRIAFGDGPTDHGILLKQLRNLARQLRIAFGPLSHPYHGIGGNADSSMISGGNLCNETVNRPDFDVRANAPGSLGKDRAGRVCVGQNENSLAVVPGDLSNIVGALVRLPATRRRLNDDKPSI